jgi:tetratricopeptide (TPR) repeat protein
MVLEPVECLALPFGDPPYQKISDRHGEAMTLDNLGLALQQVRRYEEAIAACQQAVAMHQETGDRYRQSIAQANLDPALAKQYRGRKTFPMKRRAE